MSNEELQKIELEIDSAFENNDLKHISFTQSAWTILSVAEDLYFGQVVVKELPDHQVGSLVDGLINELTHPLRVLYKDAPRDSSILNKSYIEEHYELASEWIEAADDYNHFCSMFPLYHSEQIELSVSGNSLVPSDWSTTDLSYEVYDRFVTNRDHEHRHDLNANDIVPALEASLRSSGGIYSVDFNRRLLDELHQHFSDVFGGRQVLPESWEFSHFSLAQFRAICICLQVMSEAWHVARQLVAPGVKGIAYEGSVWTPKKGKLIKIISRYVNLHPAIVQKVLCYLTFGEVGVRYPDIAVQPLVDLENGHFAISPLVLTNSDAERNLCVLLNQVPEDQAIYSSLVNDKEEQLRDEAIESLVSKGLDCKYGKLEKTDIDLAIIDRTSKTCLCVELKWFIEPAEIREVIAKTEELEKGVSQARIIHELFSSNDERLMEILGIDSTYDFQSMVGSVNFIGPPQIQDPDIPITKFWHLISNISQSGDLRLTMDWLRTRAYLPVKDRDYEIKEIPIKSGVWDSKWYGILIKQLGFDTK